MAKKKSAKNKQQQIEFPVEPQANSPPAPDPWELRRGKLKEMSIQLKFHNNDNQKDNPANVNGDERSA